MLGCTGAFKCVGTRCCLLCVPYNECICTGTFCSIIASGGCRDRSCINGRPCCCLDGALHVRAIWSSTGSMGCKRRLWGVSLPIQRLSMQFRILMCTSLCRCVVRETMTPSSWPCFKRRFGGACQRFQVCQVTVSFGVFGWYWCFQVVSGRGAPHLCSIDYFAHCQCISLLLST